MPSKITLGETHFYEGIEMLWMPCHAWSRLVTPWRYFG